MPWITEGLKTNPPSGTVLADTGAINGPATYSPELWLSSTVGITLVFEQVASDDTIVKSHTLVQASGSNEFVPPASSIAISDQDRFRVRTSGLIVGQAQASIFI